MEERKGCENCGNYRCSRSVVAIYYNLCYGNEMKLWMPRIKAVEDALGRPRRGRRSARKLRRARRAFQSVHYSRLNRRDEDGQRDDKTDGKHCARLDARTTFSH